ncbi:hypothetical protein RMB13_13500 [Acinetobacter sp. V102_4]|uniref:hypothetical protein n=1 Tax=Acinetobacter sp. V102_4 TaxID=3072984 RepID=UPI00287D453B|nr:hypothetical protein [Acinetobacter sp. V102_4]MDS7930470.1 hypothetical protein [Acinetobacter sp. V102_4]
MIKTSLEYDSSIFEQLSNRELELIWNILKPNFNFPFTATSQIHNYTNPPPLPPITKIKNDLVDHFNTSSKRESMIEVINLIIINRVIDLEKLKWIDKENFQQINFILSKIKPQPYSLELKNYNPENFITIPRDHKYKKTYNYFTPPNYPIFKIEVNKDKKINNPFPVTNGVFSATPPSVIPEKKSINEFENLIYYIDLIVLNIESKISFIESIRLEWEFHITQHNIHYDWISTFDKNQIDWCIKYLEKKEKYYPYFLIDKQNTSKYYELLILLDNIQPLKINYDHLKSIKFYETMKKSWGQQKYRSSGKLKKPYHLPLTKAAQTQLEKLAELKNTKKENIIEELISHEYSKFTDSNGKFKY